MELVRRPYSIIPVYQGQRGFSLFLMADQGRDFIDSLSVESQAKYIFIADLHIPSSTLSMPAEG
jgi:hypothetical protein